MSGYRAGLARGICVMWLLLGIPDTQADSYGFVMRDAQQKSAYAIGLMQRALDQGNWTTASQHAQMLLSLAEWITPDELDLARYVQVLVLTDTPTPDGVSRAHDLAAAMGSRPDLKALAQSRVVLAMNDLEVNPELLAFMAQQAADYLNYLPAGAAESGQRQVLNVALLPRLQTSSVSPEASALPALPWGSGADMALVVRRSIPWCVDSVWLEPVQAPRQHWSALMAETLFSELAVLHALGARTTAWHLAADMDRVLHDHIQGLRRWQLPWRLDRLLEHWQEPLMMPDSGLIDAGFSRLMQCSVNTHGSVSVVPSMACRRPVLGYWLALFSDPAFRIGIDNHQELAALSARLVSLQELALPGNHEVLSEHSDDALPLLPERLTRWLARQKQRQQQSKEAGGAEVVVREEWEMAASREIGWLLHRLLTYQRLEVQGHLRSLMLRHLAHQRQRLEDYRLRLKRVTERLDLTH